MWHGCAGGWGILFTAVGILSAVFGPKLIRDMAATSIILDSPTSGLYKGFQNSSSVTTVVAEFYLMNITNPEAMERGEEAILDRIGPFAYDHIIARNGSEIEWHPNGTMSYTYHRTYSFNAALTPPGLTEDIEIYTVNIAWLAMYNIFGPLGPIATDVIDSAIAETNTTFIQRLTARQILWGTQSDLLVYLYNNAWFGKLITRFNISLEERNNPQFFTSRTAIYTGADAAYNEAPSPFGSNKLFVTQWAGQFKNLSGVWGSDPYANMINGTDGGMLWPGITQSDRPYIFSDGLVRSVQLECVGTTTYKGIELYRFTYTKEMLMNMTENPNNRPFNMLTRGLFTTGIFGNPVLISKLYFLDCDTTDVHVHFLQYPDDMSNRDELDTFLHYEPISGQMFEAFKRNQLVAFLDPGVNVNASFKKTWFPISMVIETMEVPDNLVDDFKRGIKIPIDAAFFGGITLAVVSFSVVCIAVGCYFRSRSHRREPTEKHWYEVDTLQVLE